MSAGFFNLFEAGDSAVVVEFEPRIDPVVNARAIRLAEAVRTAAIEGVRDVVPAYRSVTVYFDPLRTQYASLVERLGQQAGLSPKAVGEAGEPIPVPVCYGSEFGPDLTSVAALAKMPPEAVVETHASTVYRVFMLGFSPGFAYMGVVDERIAAPRHSIPRVRVPRGSVAIAGQQTGIYPADTPGGWQLIGRTPVRPFDMARPVPFLFKAGDSVLFVPIDRDEYERMSTQG